MDKFPFFDILSVSFMVSFALAGNVSTDRISQLIGCRVRILVRIHGIVGDEGYYTRCFAKVAGGD